MSIETLKELKQNWKPITISVSDGRAFHVTHPDFLFITPKQADIFVFDEPDGHRFHIIYSEQIVSIERDV
jgi:hypothetical protein